MTENEWMKSGRFQIGHLCQYSVDVLLKIMGNFIIYKCEAQPWADRYEYFAISPLFDEVQCGQEIPWYDIVIHDNGVDPFRVEAIRRQDDVGPIIVRCP